MHNGLLQLHLSFLFRQPTDLCGVSEYHVHVGAVVGRAIGIKTYIIPVSAVAKQPRRDTEAGACSCTISAGAGKGHQVEVVPLGLGQDAAGSIGCPAVVASFEVGVADEIWLCRPVNSHIHSARSRSDLQSVQSCLSVSSRSKLRGRKRWNCRPWAETQLQICPGR